MSRAVFTTAVSLLALTAAATAETSQLTDTATVETSAVETVVVTASPLSKDADATAIIAGKVDRDQILQSGGGNLADALANIPGVSGSGFAAGASRPVIRGMDASRVKVMEDGVGSFDVSDIGPDHGVPIDPLSADSVEVVRGAATLRYGSGAIGGVVNAINNRVPHTLPDSIRGEATAVYASNAGLAQTSLAADGVVGSFAIHADGFYRTASDYDTPDGKQENSFFRGTGLSLGSSYFFGDTDHVGAAVVQYDAKYGIPSDTTYIVMRQTKVLSEASFDLGTDTLGALSFNGGYANYSHEEKNPDGSVNTTFKNDEYEFRGEQMIGALGPFSATAVGVQYGSRSYQALGEDSSYLYPTYSGSFAGFLFSEAPITPALKVQLGARVEHVHIAGTPASDIRTIRDFTPISGAAGLVYDATAWLKLGLTASSAARSPGLPELFARGPHDGPGTFETGNAALKIERANSLELSARIRRDRLRVEGSLWATNFDHYIYGALSGQMCSEDAGCGVPDGDLKELFYRQSGAKFRGMEVKVDYDLKQYSFGTLSAQAQYDYVHALLSGGGNVPRIPPYHVGGGLNLAGHSYDVGILALYAGRQTDFGAFDTLTPAYVDLSLHATWRPLAENPGLALSLSAHNLTDDRQRNAASFNKDTVEMPGRDIRLVLRQSL